MPPAFTLGLDYGTNSVRALIVNTADGAEVGSAVFNYPHGDAGIVLDSREPDLARQHPDDYLRGIIETVRGALAAAAAHPYFSADRIIGMGVDTTGSTPLPLDAVGLALALQPDYENHPAALAWLWKDHTGHAEAAEITRAAAAQHPEYLAKCGGTYSSEWFWAKLMRCARVAPDVMAAAHTWVELADWIPAVLTGTTAPAALKRCICAAGHKAMFHASWGGYPDAEFLGKLHPELARIRATLPAESVHVGQSVGRLSAEWAALTGLPEGIPVAAGAFDAHLGGVGSGIRPGVLVKIIGTSTCDMAVAPLSMELPDIPGICGIVPESILPGCHGLEAGQSAVGDIFNWFVKRMNAGTHEDLTAGAEKLRPGESGLLSLDWHNGNRTVLVDQRLSGLTLGQTLHTTPAEMYRSLVEATAFGARAIVERFEEYGVEIRSVINCGGISLKNPMVMQIYADILNKPLEISRSSQTCALGAAMAGAVVAGKAAGGHDDFAAATAAMTSVMPKRFQPIPENVAVYNELFQLYKQTHDAFGTTTTAGLGNVMKDLLRIRDRVRLG
jgi:L-ribulokinase